MRTTTTFHKGARSLLLIAPAFLLLLSPHIGSTQDCGDYSGCEMVQLKVSGVVTNAVGVPITNAMVTGVTTLSNHVNAIEYYEHCGDRSHKPRVEQSSFSNSGSTNDTGFYEILFIICTDDKDDFDLDWVLTIEAPGFRSQTLPGDFSDDDFDDEVDLVLIAEKEHTILEPSLDVLQVVSVGCGDYTGCDMAVLKARGHIVDEQLNPITVAMVVALESNRDNVNVVQFYNGCGDGFHEQSVEAMSTSDSNSFASDPGFFEVVFAVCHDDSKGLGAEWDADFELVVSAPGFQSQTFTATFDEDDDRDEVDFVLSLEVPPTDTPTEVVDTPTPTDTQTEKPPTSTATPEEPTNTSTQQAVTATPTPSFPTETPTQEPPTETETPTTPSVAVCVDYGGCQPIILKVLGIIQDSGGNPLSDAMVTGVQFQSTDVRVTEFFSHCGNGLHSPESGRVSFSDSVSSQIPGFYEVQFIVCVDNPSIFAADFDVCVSAPGHGEQCVRATFDNNNVLEVDDIVLQPEMKSQDPSLLVEREVSMEKGSDALMCESYMNCNMALLKTRSFITDASGNPIFNASVTGVNNSRNNVRAIQYYQHCSDGAHFLIDANTSHSLSFGTAGTSFYELQFTACIIDRNLVATDPFDADFDVCVAAPGYESKCVKSRFDENSNRHRLDIVLTAGSGPTETPTTTITPTQEIPTEVPTLTAIGTALNPNADIDRSGRIDHADLIEVLNNWFRNVE